MKRLLPLFLCCFFVCEGIAQNGSVYKLHYTSPDHFTMRLRNRAALKDTNIVLYNLNSMKGKKPGVYPLRQDNMPCIVPDTTKTVKIPNAWKGPVRVPYVGSQPRIPNAARPWLPTPITNTTTDTR